MHAFTARRSLRMMTTAAAAALALGALALPASAHTPVELTRSDVVPWQGPLIVDGENPVMLFGDLPHPGAIRSAQLHMRAGQRLIVSLSVPDEAPENTMSNDQLPTVYVVSPTFKIVQLTASTRVPITTETGLHFLALAASSAVAEAGDYSIIVVARTPSRFIVGSGVEGEPFQGLERGSVATQAEVMQWYDTPVAAPAARRAVPGLAHHLV